MSFGKFINYFVSGVGFGEFSYLAILTFVNPGIAPTTLGFASVLIMSGLVGVLSMIFETELPFTVALLIHLVGTFLLILLIGVINNWALNLLSLTLFVLIYAAIWAVIILTQLSTIRKINEKIKSRKNNR